MFRIQLWDGVGNFSEMTSYINDGLYLVRKLQVKVFTRVLKIKKKWLPYSNHLVLLSIYFESNKYERKTPIMKTGIPYGDNAQSKRHHVAY